jgi:hypothetical protein
MARKLAGDRSELDRLVDEQTEDDRGRGVGRHGSRPTIGDRRRSDVSPDAIDPKDAIPLSSGASTAVRVSGDELRQHTHDMAAREIAAAGLALPEEPMRPEDVRSDVRSGELHQQLLDLIDAARRHVESLPVWCGERTAGLEIALDAIDELGERLSGDDGDRVNVATMATTFDELLYWRARDPVAVAMIQQFRQLGATFDEVAELDLQRAMLEDRTMRRRAPVDYSWADELETNEPDAPPPEPPTTSREDLIDRLRGEWTHRLRACASILAGNWPDTIDDHEAISPAEVIAIERRTLDRLARRRRRY